MKVLTQNIKVPNDTASLEEVRRFVLDFLADSPFSGRDRRLLVLAIDEAVTSTILFSEACKRNGFTTVTLDMSEDKLLARIEDSGRDSDPDIDENFEENLRLARAHEVGVFLIRQIMDEMRYIFRKGFQNELELVRFVYPADSKK